MSELDIQKWLNDFSETAKNNDLENHMDLVSEFVATYGMPNGVTLDYASWQRRRKNEFQVGSLINLSYDKLRIKNLGLRRLKFGIEETMNGTKGEHIIINKEIILELEPKDKWRMVEENILDWDYSKQKIVNEGILQ